MMNDFGIEMGGEAAHLNPKFILNADQAGRY
jgi:hypothetical protein